MGRRAQTWQAWSTLRTHLGMAKAQPVAASSAQWLTVLIKFLAFQAISPLHLTSHLQNPKALRGRGKGRGREEFSKLNWWEKPTVNLYHI